MTVISRSHLQLVLTERWKHGVAIGEIGWINALDWGDRTGMIDECDEEMAYSTGDRTAYRHSTIPIQGSRETRGFCIFTPRKTRISDLS